MLPEDEPGEGAGNASSGEYSSTSADDLEVCEKCGREGQVLECDFPGCECLWHEACIPSDYPPAEDNARWFCPSKNHVPVCLICEEKDSRREKLLHCTVDNCRRSYHARCLPKEACANAKAWECPVCIKDRNADGLSCAVCGEMYIPGENVLIKCKLCREEAVHLACFARYTANGALPISCFTCAKQQHMGKRAKLSGAQQQQRQYVDVEVHFKTSLDPILLAQACQIIRGHAQGLERAQAFAILDQVIAQKQQERRGG